MDTTTTVIVIAAAAAAVVVIALVAMMMSRNRRTKGLRRDFGSEYEREMRTADDRRAAEAALAERRKRVDGYELRQLEGEEVRRFSERWRSVQAEFVDRPGEAVEHADQLLAEAMEARGYASNTTRERIEDVSVGHGDEAEEYRLARASALRNRSGAASTEELRQAMLHFEQVFTALLREGATAR
jgi:hypothetical protein